DFAGIDTSGSVILNATGSIFATVNNAASVNATAAGAFGTSISLLSRTALNATSIVASAPACANACLALVSLSATGDVNVGTVRATGTSFSNSVADFVNINSSAGSIRGTSGASLVTATDVSLSTGAGTGGGIFGAPTLNVDARRVFTFSPNGAFDVNLVGAGPNNLSINLGAAAAASAHSGRLRSTAGTVTLDATADPTTVNVSNFAVSGFDDRVLNTDPSISLNVPNGNLVAQTIAVPRGDARPSTTTPPFTPAGLPVSISASGNLTVENYVRGGGGPDKGTTISSTTGSVTLGSVDASRDTVFVSARTDASVRALTTAGSVTVSASNGNLDVGRVDTTSGAGSVSLFASNGTVRAMADSVGLEVLSSSSVNVTGRTIGNSAFANPLDVAGSSVTLTSPGNGGSIGFAGKAIIANTQELVINAASTFSSGGAPFNVSTGPLALHNLTLVANPAGVGAGGQAQVRTEAGQPNDRTYVFASDGANFSTAIGTVPATQFAGGTLSFTSTAGNVTLTDTNLRSGTLAIDAQSGSVTTGALDGAGISLAAGSNSGGSAVSIVTGIVGASVRPDAIRMTAGNGGTFSGTRAGSIETRSINAGDVTLTSFDGAIRIGATGTDNIGSAATRAGAVTLESRRRATAGASGAINVGNVFASGISASTQDQPVTTGNLNATGAINLVSLVSVNTGTLDAQSILVTNDGNLFTPFPQITVGTIGAQLAPTSLSLNGQAPAGGVAVRTLGAVNGAEGSTLNLLGLRNGAVILGGPIVAGAGSNIFISHRGAAPFRFTTLDAGLDGAVRIESFNAIEQTADAAGNGITAANVNLFSSTGAMTNTADPAQRIDLNTVKNLAVQGSGAMRFDAHNNTLRTLQITKNSSVANDPFELANLGAGQVITLSAAPTDLTLAVQSATPLGFTLGYNAGSITIPGAITTGGGAFDVSASGALNASGGSIATAGGSVVLRSRGGALNTGAINTTSGTGDGSINASANCGACDLVVDGTLNAGAGSVTFFGGRSITRTGAATVSASSVDFFASDGDIGTSAAPLLITTPRATLNARDFTTGGPGGLVFATLTGTTSLDLTGDNGFNVSSSAALQSLALTTRGTGTGLPGTSTPGTLDLRAPGQTYAFARPTTDLFGADITNTGTTRTFRVDNASGPGLATATFQTSDGDLLIAGAATLSAPELTLRTLANTGDLKLQGTTANPLALSQPTQNFRAGRDLLVTGNVALSSTGTQTLFADRDLTVQARSGSIAFTASEQDISTRTGSMSFIGGAANDETVTLTASTRQVISTPETVGGDVLFRAGAGDRSNVSVVYTGPNVANVFEQLIQVRGNIRIEGGAGANSDVTITTATGDQVLRAGNTADPTNVAIGNIFVTGGGGAGSDARVTNSGTGIQRIGESTCNTGVQGCPDFPYQSRNITVAGGGGPASIAAITAAGPQQIYSRGGILSVVGGAGTNATATIESTSTTDQHIGLPTYLGEGRNQLDSVVIAGGTGVGAAALVTTPVFQRVTATGGLSLTGNATATSASATLSGAGQDVRVNTITLAGGAADSSARVTSTGTQTFCGPGFSGATCTATSTGFSALTMTGGTGTNAFAQIDSAGAQTLRGGNLTLTGGGTGVSAAQRIANAGAVIRGQSQTIVAGNIQMTGGAGTGPTTTSDAVLRNLSGSQQVTANSILLTGGHEQSTTGIINEGPGTQAVSSLVGITMRSDVANAPAQSQAFVRIQNQAATQQTITSSFGGITLQNSGGGPAQVAQSLVELSSAGPQRITAQFVDVTTAAGAASTGNARITAAGNQWISTTNGGIQVAALGSGEAAITSGATQLLEVDYPGFMQGTGASGLLNVGRVTQRFAAADAAGNSRIEAVDQTVFAGGVLVKGPTGDGNTSRLSATGTQTISVLLSGVHVVGGSGANSVATIDPTSQTIVGNGLVGGSGFDVTGGSGSNADAIIASQGVQQLIATNGPMTLTGGTGPGASALVLTTGPAAQLVSSGFITPTAGALPLDADALFITGSGTAPGSFTVSCNGCPTPTLFSSDPQGNGVSNAGAVGSWNNLPFSALSAAAASTASASPDAGNLVTSERDRMLSALPDEGALLDQELRRRQYQQCQ
ncbi:MAG: hypothetical protein JWM26_205, partial [Betaproteobacteria bacterium]|nr:hypothetical protein [Betaproteobacteria bacterium]